MATSLQLWSGTCSCPWYACCTLNFCQNLGSTRLVFARHSVVKKRLASCCRRPQFIRACAGSTGEEEHFSNDTGAVGTIAISPDASLHSEERACEVLECNTTDNNNLIECNGIIARSLSDSIPATRENGQKTDHKTYKHYGDTELLSRCTSVAERSAIALAAMAYERAKRLFNMVSVNLTDLENNFRKRSKAFGFLSGSTSDIDTSIDDFKELNDRIQRLEQELNDKDHKLQLALMEAKHAHEQLRILQNSPPKVIHDVDIILDDPIESVSSDYQQLYETEAKSHQEFLHVEEKVAGLLEKVGHLNELVAGWKNAFTVLQLESQHSSEALQLSVQELVNAQVFIQNLKSLTENQATDIRAKNEQLGAVEGELSNTRKELESVSKSFSAAEQQRSAFEDHIKHLEEDLQHERETIAAVVRSSSSQKEALSAADKKVASLTSEVSSLKSLVEGKEELISAMREEARRNATMLVSAAKTREALLIAEKRIEQLSGQVNALEEEVKSRDLVLNDIKEEAVQSTEALRLAAQIKQDLNLSRQRELELTQELDRMNDIVKDLRQEVVENNRAVRAEQALRQLENEMDEMTAEVDILRKGVEARDEAIQLMKEEVDRNIDVLSHAAGNRELVHELEEHIEELKAELRKKDTMLAAMGKGLDLSGGASYKSSNSSSSSLYDDSPSNYKDSSTYKDSSNYNLPSTSTSTSPQSFVNEASKRKHVNRNTNGGGGYKRTPRHSSS